LSTYQEQQVLEKKNHKLATNLEHCPRQKIALTQT